MIGCLVLLGLMLSAAIGKGPGALIYLLLVALYLGLRNCTERRHAPRAEEGKPFAGYENPRDWRQAKRVEAWLAWGGVVVLTVTLILYFTLRSR